MQKQYPTSSVKFWTSYLVHMRPYLLFVSGIAGIMGTTIYEGHFEWWRFILSGIGFFFGYGFGQALTDVFQTDTDTISAPYRPLSRGVVSKKQIAIVSLCGLILITVLLIYLAALNALFCALSVVGLLTYSKLKRFWPLGPFHNSWIVMLLPLMGYFSMGGEFQSLEPVDLLPIFISFLSYFNFVIIGYLKDIEADRQTGYNTLPVVFGWNITLWVANANIVFYLILGFVYLNTILSISGLILLLTAAVAIAGQLKAHLASEHSPQSAVIPIANSVRAFILIHISVILANRSELFLFCLIYYILFEVALKNRPEATQI